MAAGHRCAGGVFAGELLVGFAWREVACQDGQFGRYRGQLGQIWGELHADPQMTDGCWGAGLPGPGQGGQGGGVGGDDPVGNTVLCYRSGFPAGGGGLRRGSAAS